jgi:hypothetical protein
MIFFFFSLFVSTGTHGLLGRNARMVRMSSESRFGAPQYDTTLGIVGALSIWSSSRLGSTLWEDAILGRPWIEDGGSICSAPVTWDLTCGYGRDTFVLASLVQPLGGRVIALDGSLDAVHATRSRCSAFRAPMLQVLHALHSDALELPELNPVCDVDRPRLVVANMGFLPAQGSAGAVGESLVSTAETTVPLFAHVVQQLQRGGVLSALLYPGHPLGATEALAVQNWLESLDKRVFAATELRCANRPASPCLVTVTRL